MKKTKEFLYQNKESLDQFSNFTDYEVLLIAIEEKNTNDNCIEACKSLIEGISKTVLEQVDIREKTTKERFSDIELQNLKITLEKMGNDNEEFHTLFQQALIVLNAYHHSCERDFMRAIGNKFCTYIGHIRNKKGDIAHGRAAPKLNKSSHNLAIMIEQVTDLIAFHMLEVFSLIDFSFVEKYNQEHFVFEAFLEKTESELCEIEEDEKLIRKFNQSIDKQFPLEGKPIYSLALYDQYPEDYGIQLQDFIYNIEQE